mmetsp:Transcript_40297/g.96636  ORF Transcript_40297/g.96636 Transcript_40297/m.96636 type:complete len:176 (+) Transcript_40297:86-613(+)
MLTDASGSTAPGSRILGLGTVSTGVSTGGPQPSPGIAAVPATAAVMSPGRVVLPSTVAQGDRSQQDCTPALASCSVPGKSAEVDRRQQASAPLLVGCSTFDKLREGTQEADLRSTSFNLDPIATLVSVEMAEAGPRPVHKGAAHDSPGVSAWVGGLCCPERVEGNRAKTVRDAKT